MCLAATSTSALTISFGGIDTSHDFLKTIKTLQCPGYRSHTTISSSSARQHHQHVLPRISETVDQIIRTRSRLPHPTLFGTKAPFGKAVKVQCLQPPQLYTPHRPSQRACAACHTLRANNGRDTRRIVLESVCRCKRRRIRACSSKGRPPSTTQSRWGSSLDNQLSHLRIPRRLAPRLRLLQRHVHGRSRR